MLEGAIPLHQQVSASIIDAIRTGELQVGGRLPGETELMRRFGVARGTVRRSLQTLNEKGYVQTFQGKGTYVVAGRPEPTIGQKLIGIGEGLSYSDRSMATKVLDRQILAAEACRDPRCATEEAEEILRLDRVRFLDEIPVARLVNWVRLRLAPGIESVDFEACSLFSALDQFALSAVISGRRSFEAVIAPDDVAESLGLSAITPLLFIKQTTYLEDGVPVEWSDVWMDSKQVSVTTVLTR